MNKNSQFNKCSAIIIIIIICLAVEALLTIA